MTPGSENSASHFASPDPIYIPEWKRALRPLFLFIVPILVVMYIGGIVIGAVPPDRRLSLADAIVLFAAGLLMAGILWPEVVERLRSARPAGVGARLDELDSAQHRQDAMLDDIRFVLTAELPDNERKHLEYLWSGLTGNYQGNHNLRAELRKLRALHLIDNLRPIQDIQDGTVIDLKDFVRLSEIGRRHLERLNRET